ncbi:MAG TPA: NBR1-Ig-like domain-containing protein [Longimicrobium sp.]
MTVQSNRERSDEITRQLNEFYGPMLQLLGISDVLHKTFKNGKDFRTLTKLLDGHTFSGNDAVLLREIMLVTKEIDKLIMRYNGIVTNAGLHLTLATAGAHFRVLRAAARGQLSGGPTRFEDLVFPERIRAELRGEIEQLRHERGQLQLGVPRKQIRPLCTEASAAVLVSESHPQKTEVPAGQSFTKTWTLRNKGSNCVWDSPIRLQYFSNTAGLLSTSQADIAVSEPVEPDGTYIFSVPMMAPASPGTYREEWKLVDPYGNTIRVGGAETIFAEITVPSAKTGVGLSPPPPHTHTPSPG